MRSPTARLVTAREVIGTLLKGGDLRLGLDPLTREQEQALFRALLFQKEKSFVLSSSSVQDCHRLQLIESARKQPSDGNSPGVCAAEGVELKFDGLTGGAGVFTTPGSVFCPGDTIAYVPLDHVLSSASAPFSVTPDVTDKSSGAKLTPQQALCFALLAGALRSGGGSSFLRNLISRPVVNAPFSTLKEALDLRDDDEAMRFALQTRKRVLQWDIGTATSPAMRLLLHQVGESALLGAWSVVLSRSTSLPPPFWLGIVPVVHWINHAMSPNAALVGTVGSSHDSVSSFPLAALFHAPNDAADKFLRTGTMDGRFSLPVDVLELVALRRIEPGEEVTISYLESMDASGCEDNVTEERFRHAAACFEVAYGFPPEPANQCEWQSAVQNLACETKHVMRKRQQLFLDHIKDCFLSPKYAKREEAQ